MVQQYPPPFGHQNAPIRAPCRCPLVPHERHERTIRRPPPRPELDTGAQRGFPNRERRSVTMVNDEFSAIVHGEYRRRAPGSGRAARHHATLSDRHRDTLREGAARPDESEHRADTASGAGHQVVAACVFRALRREMTVQNSYYCERLLALAESRPRATAVVRAAIAGGRGRGPHPPRLARHHRRAPHLSSPRLGQTPTVKQECGARG